MRVRATDVWRTHRLLASLRRRLPEARHLPNHELFAAVAEVRRKVRGSISAWMLSGLAAFVFGVIALSCAFFSLAAMNALVAGRISIDNWVGYLLASLWLILPTAAGVTAGGYAVRSLCVSAQLKEIIRPERCPRCQYSFAGLAQNAESRLQCPECGYQSCIVVSSEPRALQPKPVETHAATEHLSSHVTLPVTSRRKRRFRRVWEMDALDDATAQAIYLSVAHGHEALKGTCFLAIAQLVVAGIAAYAALLTLDPTTSRFPPGWVHAIATLILMVGAGVILKLIDALEWYKVVLVREAMVSMESCHACGYALDGVNPDDRGFAPCPQCGIMCRPAPALPGGRTPGPG